MRECVCVCVSRNVPVSDAPKVLQSRKLLRDLTSSGRWWSLPVHEWTTIMCSVDVEMAAEALEGKESQTCLAQKWDERHLGVPSQCKNSSVSKVSYQACRFGVCVCAQ